jgi:hypothetical protein
MPSGAPYNFTGQGVNQEIDGNLAIKSSIGTDGNLTVAGTSTLTGVVAAQGALNVTGVLTASGGLSNPGTSNGLVQNYSDSPSINGYKAWNFPIWLASSALTLVTTDIYGARFVAPYNFTPASLDLYCTNMNSGTVTLAEAAVFATAGVGGTALFAAPDIHAAWTTTGVQTFTWATPTALVAGTTYVLQIITTATTSGPSIAAAPTVAAYNVNLGAGLGNMFTYGTGAALTTASTYTLASGTNSGTTPFWFGLR